MEQLALEIAQLVNTLGEEDREQLREHAERVLREEVRGKELLEDEPEVRASTSFNPLGIGIPVLFMGGLLLVIFPPVGLFLFGVAALLMTWGVLATLFTKRSAGER